MTARCPICLARPARTPDEHHISCAPCRSELDQKLAGIATTTAEGFDIGTSTASFVSIGGRGANTSAPLRLDILALITPGNLAVGPVLEAYARQVHGEGTHGSDGTLIGKLRANLEWIDQQPWLGNFARDVRRLHDAVQAASGERRIRVAHCPQCGGNVYATLTSDTARCERCANAWERDHWRLLGKLQETG